MRYALPIRIEVAADSELPAQLRELGYDLMFREHATRIGAGAVTGYAFRTVNVFELKLPK